METILLARKCNKDAKDVKVIQAATWPSEEDMKDKELIDAYMDMNKYYPVTFGAGSAQSPEKGKVDALREFQQYVKYLANLLK
jgi:hypothetical protein